MKNKSRAFLRGIRPRRKNSFDTHSSPQQVAGYSGKVRDKTKKSGFTLPEVLIVAAIMSLLMGAMFTFLMTTRISSDTLEAGIQSKEYGQQVLEKIVKELRLTRAGKVRITNSLGWTAEASPGQVINFQIPVGIYADTLNLTAVNELRWGDTTAENRYLAYSVNANSQLVRSSYNASDLSNAVSQIIAPRISALNFSRTSPTSNLIRIQVTASVPQALLSGPITQTLDTEVKLRN